MFRVILKDDRYHICLGNMLASGESFENEADANQYIEAKPWDLIFCVCAMVAHNSTLLALNQINGQLKSEDNGVANVEQSNNQ